MHIRNHLVNVLAMLVLMSPAGCRDGDGDGNDNNNNTNQNTGDNTVYQVQDPDHQQHLREGDAVRLEDVVVTAVDTYGERTGNVWVQEPDGGAFSGVMVFSPAVVGGTIDDIQVGDLVTVAGEIDEFALDTDTSGRTVTEIANGSIEVQGQSSAPAPEVVTAQEVMSDPAAEQWEGVLVKVENVRVLEKSTAYEEVTFVGGLVAQSDLYDAFSDLDSGVCYSEITGVMNYFFGYFVLPRSAADIVQAANDGDCEEATAEDCTDGVDNDGDGFVDCDDWDCDDHPACRESDCSDGVDNDGDGLTDCDDPDCLGTTDCPAPAENTDALCDDGQDNDGDNLVDCEDPSCHGHPDVTVCFEDDCTDGVDNDGDGYVDCDDLDCEMDPACYEMDCSDGVDNDGDGYVDCDDHDCWLDSLCIQSVEEEIDATECTDGIDNDGDEYIDCDDFSCQEYYPECTETDCSDGVDNNDNGFTDCDDWDCQEQPGACPGTERNEVSCSDGLDNDGNGFVDCADFGCRCCPNDPQNPCSGLRRWVSTCPPCD